VRLIELIELEKLMLLNFSLKWDVEYLSIATDARGGVVVSRKDGRGQEHRNRFLLSADSPFWGLCPEESRRLEVQELKACNGLSLITHLILRYRIPTGATTQPCGGMAASNFVSLFWLLPLRYHA